ncbi:putative phage tail assembly chaperone [Pasteurella skyensis]|uniref:Phage tail assembly chaperone n=1 Tax=Phocoenobacter skyensis TaxID=97481 RepID=A0AAJ6P1G4_9PAST|nr:putative phage tail assembly chaperone [Pasteurella skyensis]MDP8173684.1 putative phage tail assembly chaperone [Pasteurella skyensis]MDP8178052.1 putative phage tail assembly chaperone [Pasteurella skyensis]
MTQATSILEQLGINLKNEVTIKINDKLDLTFKRDNSAYDEFLNSVTSDNKLVPTKDYLLAIVKPAQREALSELLQFSEIALAIVEKVDSAFKPSFELKIKN